MSMNNATATPKGVNSTNQRQLNIRSLYPQVKASTTPISFDANGLASAHPLINFDHHYSSDEEMTSSNAKKIRYQGLSHMYGKKSTGIKVMNQIPAIRRKEDEGNTPKEISENTIIKNGAKVEAAIIREDEGFTAVKRRKMDCTEAVNTQTSVRTADTMSELKISPQSMEMSQSLSEITQPSQNCVSQDKKNSQKNFLSQNTLKQIQLLKQIQGKAVPQKKPIEQAKIVQPLSSATTQVIKDLLNQKKQAPSTSKQLQQVSLEELLSQDSSMKSKHEQLLVPERELVLPVHYKKLLDIFKFLDSSLNFLKLCRRQSACSYDELKKSIEKSNGKQFDLDSFRKILTMMPDSYTHRWDTISGKASLMIDFPEDDKQLSQQKMDARYQSLKKQLVGETIKHYQKFLQEMIDRGESDPIIKMDPLKVKMWHSKFDVHQVPAIQMFELKQPVRTQRSESVKDFLNRSKLTSNLEIPQIPSREIEQSVKPNNRGSSPLKNDVKLIDMSKKTGISIETLRIIQQKQDAITKAKEALNQTIKKEDTSKQCQELAKIADQIRQMMLSKQKQTLPLKDILTSLVDTQRGAFRSQAEIFNLVNQLCSLAPTWISIKEIGSAGKFVKCNNQVSAIQVQETIRSKITADIAAATTN